VKRQHIIPRASFSCNGRITGITASMRRNANGTIDPHLEVWHPQSPGSDVFDKVGEAQLVEDNVVQVDNDNNTYWLLNMSLNGSEKIEFEAGDVIGFYHPPDARYQVWTIDTDGYILHGYISANSSTIFNLDNADIFANNRQPLIKFLLGA